MLLSILDDSGQGKMLGAIEHMTKPFEEHILLERIGNILSTERGRSVLVVDDDNDLRALIATNLRRAGYNVIEAASAAEAMTLARSTQPALALIDIRMPDVSGVELLRALRSDAATHTIPVMTMSASPDATQEHRSVIEALGATALMTKPYTRRQTQLPCDNRPACAGRRRRSRYQPANPFALIGTRFRGRGSSKRRRSPPSLGP
jgi:two-component system phosphate regulon response regulator PhoB